MALDCEVEFARLVLPHRARMQRAIWGVLRDAGLAEDALQDALVILWRKLRVLRHHPNPEAFVLRVSIDAARDQWRARRRRDARARPLEALRRTPARGDDLAIDPVEQAETRTAVLAAIDRLGSRQASAILLRAVEDEAYSDVAQALGCSEATARVHVQRARVKLRQWLGHLRPAPRERST